MTLLAPDTFWQFEHCSKIDVLDEQAHLRLILAALRDKNTSVEQIDRQTFSLVGPDQAILVQPVSSLLILTLRLHQAVTALERPQASDLPRPSLAEPQPQT